MALINFTLQQEKTEGEVYEEELRKYPLETLEKNLFDINTRIS